MAREPTVSQDPQSDSESEDKGLFGDKNQDIKNPLLKSAPINSSYT